MKNISLKNNWIYGLLLISVILAILALVTSDFFLGSGTAGMGIVILLILSFKKTKSTKDAWLIIGAFLFSIAGDWFMSNMNGDAMMFSKGIALFFVAHIGYFLYAIINGKIKWFFTSILLAAFLVFYFVLIYPVIDDKILMAASLIYLLISCLSLGASVGIKGDFIAKWAYITGIFFVLFSDTIISFTEFLRYDKLDFLILPTYYLAHISITFSLIRKVKIKNYIYSS
ncbi:MAG: lysoplasmalogenase [Bacteroidota bacterium]